MDGERWEWRRKEFCLYFLGCFFFKSVLEGIWELTPVKFIRLTNLMFKCY